MFTSENNDDYDCSLLTYKEAVTSTDRRNWEKAIQSEMESLQKNNTWVLVDKSEAKGQKYCRTNGYFGLKMTVRTRLD